MSFNPDEQRDRVASERPLSNKSITFGDVHEEAINKLDCAKSYNWTPSTTMSVLKNIVHNGVFNGRSFESICCELIALHEKKNKDYGGAFYKSMSKFGVAALMIRLNDKWERLESLFKNGKAEVTDESFEDTLRDIACYAIMGLEHLYNTPQP